MPFPAGATTITVTGTFPVPVAGAARAGSVVFTPSTVLVDSTQQAIYSGAGSADLDTNGQFTTTLLCTDDTDVQPAGWRWRVDEQPTGGQRRTYWVDLPSSLGATVDLSELAPVSDPGGSGQSLPPTGPAGGALTGSYPNPSLSAATIATFDAAGSAAAAQAAAEATAAADATAKVAAHEADTTSVHGVADTADLVITTDPRLSDDRTPTAHAASHADGGTDEITLTQAQITGLTAALAALLPLAGGTISGALTVEGYTTLEGGQFNSDFAAFGDMTLIGTGKRYRLRRSGGALDFEGGGVDMVISMWSAEDFTGTQRSYFRLSADAQNVQVAGPLESVAALYGAAVHRLDPVTGVASLGGKNGLGPVKLAGFKSSAGAPITGTWDAGDAVLDSAGLWHLCLTSGTPGVWT